MPEDRSSKMTDDGQDGDEPEIRWAGHGHVGAFLLQISVLIAVNLAG